MRKREKDSMRQSRGKKDRKSEERKTKINLERKERDKERGRKESKRSYVVL